MHIWIHIRQTENLYPPDTKMETHDANCIDFNPRENEIPINQKFEKNTEQKE